MYQKIRFLSEGGTGQKPCSVISFVFVFVFLYNGLIENEQVSTSKIKNEWEEELVMPITEEIWKESLENIKTC